MDRFETEHADERLHGVVGEHAAAAALTRTGVQRNFGSDAFVGVGGVLECGHEIDALTSSWIVSGLDRTVRQDDRGDVVLEHCGHGADGGLVARHHRHEALDLVRCEVGGRSVVHQFTADQREAHLRGAVELSVGHADGERRSDETVATMFTGDTSRHRRLHRGDF